ncbi:MAG: hypothetical protein ACFCVE_00305 [Phycisphaerae bacterium]
MKFLFKLAIFNVMLLITLGGWGLAAMSLHVVRTGERSVVLVPKETLSIRTIPDTYVDVRGWTLQDVQDHPELAKRLIEAGRSDVLDDVLAGEGLTGQLAAVLGIEGGEAAELSLRDMEKLLADLKR